MGYLNFIACHGSKCRQGIDGHIWCTDCFGELDCHNLCRFLKPQISFSDIPVESIVYAECETVKIDWNNKEHTDSLKTFSYYVRGLNEQIQLTNNRLNEKKRMLSDYRIIGEFTKTSQDLELVDALQRVVPTIDVGELELVCSSLQNDHGLLNNELDNAISCNGEMPEQLLDLLNISIHI